MSRLRGIKARFALPASAGMTVNNTGPIISRLRTQLHIALLGRTRLCAEGVGRGSIVKERRGLWGLPKPVQTGYVISPAYQN